MSVTLNPFDCNSDIILSNGNLTATADTTAHKMGRATTSKSTGKWYFEVKIDVLANVYQYHGFATALATLNSYLGVDSYGWGYSPSGHLYHSGSATNFSTTLAQGDVLGCAVDVDTGDIWFSKNGVWIQGDPGAGSNPMDNMGTGLTVFPAISLYTTTSAVTCNFGASAFDYDIPNGFVSWDADGGSTSLSDMELDIQAFYSSMDDVGLDLAGYYQAMESCPMDIHAMGNIIQDNKLDLLLAANGFQEMPMDVEAYFESLSDAALDAHIAQWARKYNKLDLSAALQEIGILPISVIVAAEQTKNTFLDIELSDGVLTGNMAMDIGVGDGNKIQSRGLNLMAVSTMPEFKSIYAIHLNSAIREI